jgi:hypothetical protein
MERRVHLACGVMLQPTLWSFVVSKAFLAV